MNTFYIILHIKIYENTSIFPYLDIHKFHTVTSLCSLNALQLLTVENMLLSGILYRYVERLEKTNVFNMKIPIQKQKYEALKKIIDNNFLSDETHDYCINFVGKCTKYYHSLSRLVRLWKLKQASCPVTTDLFFNEIDHTKPYTFSLFQNEVMYLFRISDLLRSIEQKIITYDFVDFEICSEQPVNPYNKVVLKKHELYNLYFKVLFSDMTIPLYFRLFFENDFNLSVFSVKHDTLLKKMAIKNYIFNEPNTNLRMAKSILDMIEKNSYMTKLKIHKEFPTTALVDTFRPYLYLEYLLIYGNLECDVAEYYETLLFTKLRNFYINHPQYGRKIYKTNIHGFNDSTTFNFMDNNQEKKKLIKAPVFYFNTEHTPIHTKNL